MWGLYMSFLPNARPSSPHTHRQHSDSSYPLEIVALDLKEGQQGEDSIPATTAASATRTGQSSQGPGGGDLASFLPTARLVKDLRRWHDETFQQEGVSLSMAGATAQPPSSPSACLRPLSLSDNTKEEEEDKEETVLLWVTTAGEGEGMEVEGEGALFRVAAPLVCARCPAIRVCELVLSSTRKDVPACMYVLLSCKRRMN